MRLPHLRFAVTHRPEGHLQDMPDALKVTLRTFNDLKGTFET